MRGDKQPAKGFATRLFLGVARGVALAWLAPALLFNVDWTGHGTWQANTAAVFMILGSALFIEGALRLRSWVLTPVCILAAFFLVYVNTKQATRVLSLAGEAAREAKLATLAEGSHLGSQGSQWVAKRKVQVEIAGETTVGTLEAELEVLQLSDLRAWNATSECKDVTVKASAALLRSSCEGQGEDRGGQGARRARREDRGAAGAQDDRDTRCRGARGGPLRDQHHRLAQGGRLRPVRAAGEGRGGDGACAGLRAAGRARAHVLARVRQHAGGRRRSCLGALAEARRQAREVGPRCAGDAGERRRLSTGALPTCSRPSRPASWHRRRSGRWRRRGSRPRA